jgi:uncharacterized protein (TIGR02466 family)
MSEEFNKISPFHTSMYFTNVRGYDLAEFVKSLQPNTESLTKSNAGGWHSPLYDGKNMHMMLRPFFNELQEKMALIYEDMGILKKPELLNYWFMINKKYAYNQVHNHPHCFFSGVFYIKIPQNSGRITFKRPDVMADWLPLDVMNENNSQMLRVNPEIDRLIIFPAYLEHCVEQNLTEDEDDTRISLSFNYA